MNNVRSAGSLGEWLITNEDWQLLCQVIDYDLEKELVYARKYWNPAASMTYTVHNMTGNIPVLGSSIIIYRCGEYNSAGLSGPELRVKNGSKYSWLCYPAANWILVEDAGNGTGREVNVNAAGHIVPKPISKYLTLKALPGQNYHSAAFPSVYLRLYFAQEANKTYYVDLEGYGADSQYLDNVINYELLRVETDSKGLIKGFKVG